MPRFTSEILIVGGGRAELQAALTVARVHRQAVVLDDGRHRNASVARMHNMIGLTAPHPTSSTGVHRPSWPYITPWSAARYTERMPRYFVEQVGQSKIVRPRASSASPAKSPASSALVQSLRRQAGCEDHHAV